MTLTTRIVPQGYAGAIMFKCTQQYIKLVAPNAMCTVMTTPLNLAKVKMVQYAAKYFYLPEPLYGTLLFLKPLHHGCY